MEKTEKIWNRKFILLFITNLLVLAAFYASIPIIPIYCQEIGITGSKIGIVLTAMSVATILFRPVAGYLLDNFNRYHVYCNIKRLAHAQEVLRTVVVADDRLRAGRDTNQNGNQNLVDLHHDTHSRQRDFRTVNGLRAVCHQQVVGQSHDDRDGDLRDEAADAKAQDFTAGLDFEPECRSIKAEGLKMEKVNGGHDKGCHLSHDGCDSGATNAHIEHKNEDRVKYRIDDGAYERLQMWRFFAMLILIT